MKLMYKITVRVMIALTVILTIWAVFFYYAMIIEVNDEIDDNLDSYSEMIIRNFNNGEELPTKSNGTNNSYHIELLSDSYIDITPSSVVRDEMVYITEKEEDEPARILKTTFRATNGKSYQLIVYTPTIESSDLIESILFAIIYLVISLLITIVIINVWVYNRSMKPLYNILNWLDTYRLGAKNIPLNNPTDIVEFDMLNKTIKHSMEDIEHRYIKQKEFIDHVSHELQTPIAICQNRMERLQDRDLTKEQMSEVFKTLNTLEYMKRLNKTILFLSRIENKQFTDCVEVVVNPIVRGVVSDFEEIYQSSNIKIELIEQNSLTVNMNEILARTLIVNLIKNAFVHNNENGVIRIVITETNIVIENSGAEPLDDKLIFERFHRDKNKPNSTGLGLAIVNSICKLYEFNISYNYKKNTHFFKIIF